MIKYTQNVYDMAVTLIVKYVFINAANLMIITESSKTRMVLFLTLLQTPLISISPTLTKLFKGRLDKFNLDCYFAPDLSHLNLNLACVGETGIRKSSLG